MKLSIRLTALLLAALLVLTACGGNDGGAASGADSSDTTVIHLGYLPITHALAIFEEKELLESENSGIQIELEKFSS